MTKRHVPINGTQKTESIRSRVEAWLRQGRNELGYSLKKVGDTIVTTIGNATSKLRNRDGEMKFLSEAQKHEIRQFFENLARKLGLSVTFHDTGSRLTCKLVPTGG